MKYTFKTEVAWGDLQQWHKAKELVIEVTDESGSELSNLSWKKLDGTVGSISFQPDMKDFLGYYQKPKEGPVAYRGTRR